MHFFKRQKISYFMMKPTQEEALMLIWVNAIDSSKPQIDAWVTLNRFFSFSLVLCFKLVLSWNLLIENGSCKFILLAPLEESSQSFLLKILFHFMSIFQREENFLSIFQVHYQLFYNWIYLMVWKSQDPPNCLFDTYVMACVIFYDLMPIGALKIERCKVVTLAWIFEHAFVWLEMVTESYSYEH